MLIESSHVTTSTQERILNGLEIGPLEDGAGPFNELGRGDKCRDDGKSEEVVLLSLDVLDNDNNTSKLI